MPDEGLWANEYMQLVCDGTRTAGMNHLKALSESSNDYLIIVCSAAG